MAIQGISNSFDAFSSLSFLSKSAAVADLANPSIDDSSGPKVAPVPPEAATPNQPPPVDTDEPAAQKQRGVIRLLADGHFRGVADVRLRTIFADQLSAAGITLPEPSPPHGNGRAYAKHLAAYDAARGAAGQVDQSA